ncbi:MAG: DUF4956 domain-containing protein [Gemmatimonadales bacterium]
MASPTQLSRLVSALGIQSGSRVIGRTTMVRLILYYAVVLPLISLFILLTERWRPAVAQMSPDSMPGGFWAPLLGELPPLGFGAAAVAGAFLLAIPVAFVYVRTRSSLKYDQSLVQTVIMLPVVVTAILIVVENSLALAFSLAGIVAAVRFRNNLKDSRDAVYIFAAVGLGFASGVGHLAIAAFLSVFFALLELLLWKLDLTADHERTFGLLCMPARPGEPGTIVPLTGSGPAEAVSADTPLLDAGGGEPSFTGRKGRKPAETLRLYVTEPDKIQPMVEAVLARTTKKYRLKKNKKKVKKTAADNLQETLDYAVRTRKASSTEEIINQLYEECSPFLIAAETVVREGG